MTRAVCLQVIQELDEPLESRSPEVLKDNTGACVFSPVRLHHPEGLPLGRHLQHVLGAPHAVTPERKCKTLEVCGDPRGTQEAGEALAATLSLEAEGGVSCQVCKRLVSHVTDNLGTHGTADSIPPSSTPPALSCP